jgi:hypothetical protein
LSGLFFLIENIASRHGHWPAFASIYDIQDWMMGTTLDSWTRSANMKQLAVAFPTIAQETELSPRLII